MAERLVIWQRGYSFEKIWQRRWSFGREGSHLKKYGREGGHLENTAERVNRVNDALNENRLVEKMVKQVIGGGEKISEEGRTVLSSYMSSVRGLNNLLGETLEDPIIINGRETKDLRDKATRVPKADNCQKVDSDSSETVHISVQNVKNHLLMNT